MRWKILITIIVLAIAGYLAYLFFAPAPFNPGTEVIYNNDPDAWIGADANGTAISVEESTFGRGLFAGNSLQYNDDFGERVFSVDGYYFNNYIGKEYKDSAVRFRIGPNMKPKDGVKEAFAIVKRENRRFCAYLFIDEDWKKTANINVIWGADFANASMLSERAFNTTYSENGIYVDKVCGLDFFESTEKAGGVVFGDLSLADFEGDSSGKIYLIVQ